jgi:hypothetical protein
MAIGKTFLAATRVTPLKFRILDPAIRGNLAERQRWEQTCHCHEQEWRNA